MKISTLALFHIGLMTVAAGLLHAQAPVVLGALPAANATQAPNAGGIYITFSQPVSATRAADIAVFGSQSQGRRTGRLTGGGTSALAFQPSIPYAPGEQVQVTVPASVGGPSRTWQFTAAASQGTGTFGAVPDVPIASIYYSNQVVAADVNGDGSLDLVSSNSSSSNTVSVHLNDGAAQFGAPTFVPVLPAPKALAMADIDNDGDLDLLSASYQTGSGFSLRLNDGLGHFGGGTDVRFQYQCAPDRIAAVDVDGDGYLDVITSNSDTDNSMGVCRNNGNGTFAPVVRVPVSRPKDMAVGDLNGDGAVDFIVQRASNYASGPAQVPAALVPYFNDGQGNFTAGQPLLSMHSIASTAVGISTFKLGDVDGDNDLDLVIVDGMYTGAPCLDVAANDGTGNFTLRHGPAQNAGLHNIALGDVDGDGDLDLVGDIGLTGAGAQPDILSVQLNDGIGGFYPIADGSLPHVTGGLTLADINGDGALDIIASGSMRVLGIRLSQLAQPPLLLSPGQGAVGSTVVLTGTGLQGTTEVRFNGTLAPGFAVNAAGTALTVAVPAGTRSGRVSVSTPRGISYSTQPFTVLTPTSARGAIGTLAGAVYPNPAHQNVRLEIVGGTDQVTIQLLDALGRCALQQTRPRLSGNEPMNVSLAGVAAGLYTMRVTSGAACLTRRLEIQ